VLEKEENRTTLPFYGNGNSAILWSSGEAQKYRKKLRREINMGKGNNEIILVALALAMFVSMLPIGVRAQTLQPRLLWEKTTPFEIGSIEMARQSGDVIISSRGARQIILYDKDGNKRFHWGPRIDRQPMGIDISDDGNTIVFTSLWTETYVEKKRIDINRLGWDNRVHYLTRKGKELWNKQIEGSAFLSPNGSLVAVVGEHGMGGVPLTVLDSKGNMLWKYPTQPVLNLRFSPDGNYILFYDGNLYLFHKSGNLLWKKTDVLEPQSVSEGATYITTKDKKVFDKQGNIFLEVKAIVSGDGKRLLVVHPDKVSIMSLPDKTLIREYRGGGFLSHDGRFLIALSPSGNELIIDTVNQVSSEIPIKNISVSRLQSTRDGKYLIYAIEKKKLIFYQAY
jgi:WD40 repeat protein